MTKKQKKMLIRIIIAAVMLAALHFIPVTGWLRLALYLVTYVVIGYDIMKKAGQGILNGRVFDETDRTQCPAVFRLYEVIDGWQIALSRMRPGDRWRIYIPSDMAYGSRTIDGIPGNSTLIFDVELLSIA